MGIRMHFICIKAKDCMETMKYTDKHAHRCWIVLCLGLKQIFGKNTGTMSMFIERSVTLKENVDKWIDSTIDITNRQ